MKKRTRKAMISMFVIACLFLNIAPITAVSEELPGMSEAEKLMAGMVSIDDVYGELNGDTVPEIIGYDYAVSKSHVQRLYAAEGADLNKVVFLNADGTQTAYFFDYPVKYVDESGKTKDITLDIADSAVSGEFKTADGSAVTTFSRNLSDGIGLRGNNTSLSLIPHLPTAKAGAALSSTATLTANSTAERIDRKTVSYDYDSKTTIEYSLTYTGFKEDIVVSEYTGQTEYDFTLYTNGLTLTEVDGSFYLVDGNNTVKAALGDIIIFTADEKNNTMGEMTAQTMIENQEYLLTISVDAEYLAAEETVYPIRIDPSVEICYDNDGAGAIQDVTLNSLQGSSGTSGSLMVGLRETYGKSRILMKFPGLDVNALGSNVSITEATVELRDLMCETAGLEVSCYVFTGNVWDESTANWSNVSPDSYTTFLSSQTISYANGTQQSTAHRYAFDITKAVEGWRAGNYNPNKGILFKASSSVEGGTTYKSKTLASYNRSSNKPSLSVTYLTGTNLAADDTYYLNNQNCGDYLRYTSSGATAFSGLTAPLGNSIRWEIRAVSSGYVIRSKSDTTKYLGVPTSTGSSTVSLVTVSEAAIPDRCVWKIQISAVGGCLVRSAYNSRYLYSAGNAVSTMSGTGTAGTEAYDKRVWRIISQSDFANKELTSDSVFNTLVIGVGETGTPTITPDPLTAIWIECEDFTYIQQSATYVSVTKGVFTGQSPGVTTIIATHKSTNQKFVFSVVVGNIPIFTVHNYIDQGYRIRFEGYANVQTYTLVVADKLERFFGLDVSRLYILHNSAADQCKINEYGSVTSDNLVASCAHSPTHLTNTALRDTMGNGTNINTKVLWTGHILVGNPSSDSISQRCSVIITPRYTTHENDFSNKSDTDIRRESLFTFMHELSHQLGTSDHYCYGVDTGETVCINTNCDVCYKGKDKARTCIMSHRCNIETTNEATLYCSDCLITINEHLSDHHQ